MDSLFVDFKKSLLWPKAVIQNLNFAVSAPARKTNIEHVTVASEPKRIGVFLTRSCVHVIDISCGVVYEATLASLVLFRSYCYVARGARGEKDSFGVLDVLDSKKWKKLG